MCLFRVRFVTKDKYLKSQKRVLYNLGNLVYGSILQLGLIHSFIYAFYESKITLFASGMLLEYY